MQRITTLQCQALTKGVAGLIFYNHSALKGSLIWRKKRWKILKLQRKKTFTSVLQIKHCSSLLTSIMYHNCLNTLAGDVCFYKQVKNQ